MVRAGGGFGSMTFGARWFALCRRLVPLMAAVLVASFAPGTARAAWAAPAAVSGPGGDVSVPVGVGAARAGVASPTDGPGVTAIDRKVLPRAGSADVTTGGAVVSAGGLPVSITVLAAVDLDVLTQRTAARAAVAPVRVRVTVADEGVARAAGVAGVVLRWQRPDRLVGRRSGCGWTTPRSRTRSGEGRGAVASGRYRLCLEQPGRRECHTPIDLGSVNGRAQSRRRSRWPASRTTRPATVAWCSGCCRRRRQTGVRSRQPRCRRRTRGAQVVRAAGSPGRIRWWCRRRWGVRHLIWRCIMTPGRWTVRLWRRTVRPRGWARAGICSWAMWSGRTGRAPRMM